jgi:hypothetical protein
LDEHVYRKACVVAELYDVAKADDAWAAFFNVYVIGVPLARMIAIDCAEPTDEGVHFIEEAWFGLCHMMEVDSTEEFASLDELVENSRSRRGD